MATGKTPLVSILMAVYRPRMDWLREQLISLNTQTYPNLELLILDDGSPEGEYRSICDCVKQCVTAFPVTVGRNERNLGSNLTFQWLTQRAEGGYLAYCDQDDIWLPEKVARLVTALEEQQSLLVCSDMYIIDGEGRQIAGSITQVRRSHRFRSGEGLAGGLLLSNFVTGTAMLVCSEAAKAAVPFCPHMVHDHYLALYCANRGRITSLSEPLLCYRIHQNNQTGVMAGVTDRESYYRIRILELCRRTDWLREHFSCDDALRAQLEELSLWVQARKGNYLGQPGAWRQVWKHRRWNWKVSLFEITALRGPQWLFMLGVEGRRRNVL